MLNTKFDLYKSEWLDLVFSDRNKSYGAYELRKNSGQYAMRALAATIAIFATGILLTKVWPQNHKAGQIKDVTTEVNIQKYVEPVKPKKEMIHEAVVKPLKSEAPKVNIHTDKFLVPKPTNEPVPDEPLKGQNEITNPGPIDNKGDGEPTKTIVDSQPSAAVTPGGGQAVDPNIVYNGVDEMPEPAGGMAGWSKFLQRNIRYPETEAQGKVLLSFVIEKDGKISNITLTRGVDQLLDEEAMRVLRIAPAWKPGRQGGQPVRVRYTLPINFQMN